MAFIDALLGIDTPFDGALQAPYVPSTDLESSLDRLIRREDLIAKAVTVRHAPFYISAAARDEDNLMFEGEVRAYDGLRIQVAFEGAYGVPVARFGSAPDPENSFRTYSFKATARGSPDQLTFLNALRDLEGRGFNGSTMEFSRREYRGEVNEGEGAFHHLWQLTKMVAMYDDLHLPQSLQALLGARDDFKKTLEQSGYRPPEPDLSILEDTRAVIMPKSGGIAFKPIVRLSADLPVFKSYLPTDGGEVPDLTVRRESFLFDGSPIWEFRLSFPYFLRLGELGTDLEMAEKYPSSYAPQVSKTTARSAKNARFIEWAFPFEWYDEHDYVGHSSDWMMDKAVRQAREKVLKRSKDYRPVRLIGAEQGQIETHGLHDATFRFFSPGMYAAFESVLKEFLLDPTRKDPRTYFIDLLNDEGTPQQIKDYSLQFLAAYDGDVVKASRAADASDPASAIAEKLFNRWNKQLHRGFDWPKGTRWLGKRLP